MVSSLRPSCLVVTTRRRRRPRTSAPAPPRAALARSARSAAAGRRRQRLADVCAAALVALVLPRPVIDAVERGVRPWLALLVDRQSRKFVSRRDLRGRSRLHVDRDVSTRRAAPRDSSGTTLRRSVPDEQGARRRGPSRQIADQLREQTRSGDLPPGRWCRRSSRSSSSTALPEASSEPTWLRSSTRGLLRPRGAPLAEVEADPLKAWRWTRAPWSDSGATARSTRTRMTCSPPGSGYSARGAAGGVRAHRAHRADGGRSSRQHR